MGSRKHWCKRGGSGSPSQVSIKSWLLLEFKIDFKFKGLSGVKRSFSWGFCKVKIFLICLVRIWFSSLLNSCLRLGYSGGMVSTMEGYLQTTSFNHISSLLIYNSVWLKNQMHVKIILLFSSRVVGSSWSGPPTLVLYFVFISPTHQRGSESQLD